MIKPDENYDWDDAIGYLFHQTRGWTRTPNSYASGFITRISKSRVYYKRGTAGAGSETFCNKDAIALVEVSSEQSATIGDMWAIRQDVMETAKKDYLGAVDNLCD